MTSEHPTPEHELEEAAQGQDLYAAPGKDLHIEDARDQAEASGWLPPDVVYATPTPDTHGAIVRRRKDVYDAMLRLEESLARSSRLEDWRQEVAEALDGVEEALRRHVGEIEAPGGLFAEVVDLSPEMTSAVELLREEHAELERLTATALDTARSDRLGDPSQLRTESMAVIDLLVTHRQTGAEMLFDAYNVDIGGED